MKNLFKEVWKSLFKNKATVAGLTILVFLTAGIFTLLHDTARSMKLQYNQIKNESKAHDLTIDLNLSTNAKAYNDGYLINGLAQEEALPDAYNKPLRYIASDYNKFSNIINLKNIDEDFISLSNFVDDPQYLDKYIKKTDFIKMYNQFKSENEATSSIKFDYTQAKKYFTLNSNYVMDLYAKSVQDGHDIYSIASRDVELTPDTELHFDKEYKLSDIAYLSTYNNKIILSQLSVMFINAKTKEVTFDLLKGQTWKKTGPVILVNPEDLAPKLGFTSYNGSSIIFEMQQNPNSDIVKYQDNNLLDVMNEKLATSVKYKSLSSEEYKVAKEKEFFIFAPNQKYNIPVKWAAKQQNIVYFQRKVYQSTYIDYKNKWDGAYAGFMESLLKNNNGEIPSQFRQFSYWSKNILNYIYSFDVNGALIEDKNSPETSKTSQDTFISMDEILDVKLSLAPIDQQIGVANAEKTSLEYINSIINKAFIIVNDYLTHNKTDSQLSKFVTDLDTYIKQSYEKYQNLKNGEYAKLEEFYNEMCARISEIEKSNNIAATTLSNNLPKLDNKSGTKIPNYKAYSYEKPRTIAEMENIKSPADLTQSVYKNLIDKNILVNTFSIIKNGALNIVKKNIYESVKNFKYTVDGKEYTIGADNIGIKEQLTIDSFDANTNEKNVFQFVNIGNSDNEINGIANNINKLINEAKKSTNLRETSLEIDNFFRTKQLDYYVSKVILVNAIENITPDPNYIKSDYQYNTMMLKNYNSGNLIPTMVKGQKIYKLANFVENATNDTPLSEFNNFANLGITAIKQNETYFYVLKPHFNVEGKLAYWENIPLKDPSVKDETIIKQLNNGMLNTNNLESFLRKNKLVLKSELNPHGWVEADPEFNNVVYVPFAYRGPSLEVMNEALNQGSMTKAVDNMQKAMLEMDLVKEGFISKDVVYALTDAIDYSFKVNDFASVFASGQIKLSYVPKIAFDTFYKMSHNINGDYLNKMLVGILSHAKHILSQIPTLEGQKQYLVAQITSFFNLAGLIGNDNLNSIISPSGLVYASKDPVKLLDYLIGIINSIDFIKFTDFTNNFYQNEFNKEIEDTVKDPVTGKDITVKYKRRTSYHELVIWLLKSIDSDMFKSNLKNIIKNLDLKSLNDENNVKSPLHTVLKNMSSLIKNIINKIDIYKNTISGVEYLIDAFDINLFASSLEASAKLEKFYSKGIVFDYRTQRETKIHLYSTAISLSNVDYIYALLKAFFTLPGSNKTFKDEVIKMFNLSGKGYSVDLGNNSYITVPAPDNEKLGYFDLINSLQGTNASSNSASTLTKSEMFVNKYLAVLNKQQSDEVLNYFMFSEAEQPLASYILRINKDDNIITKEDALVLLNKWNDLLAVLKQSSVAPVLGENSSIADVISWYANVNAVDSNLTFDLIKNILSTFISKSSSKIDSYSYLSEGYPLYQFWFSIFDPELKMDVNLKKAFANELLNIANQKEVLDSFNSFELFQPSADNITEYQTTKFGITRSMANIIAMKKNFFETDKDGNYTNPILKQLVNKFPDFKSFIKHNEFNITQSFAYIGSSHLYNKVTNSSTFNAPEISEGDRHFTTFKFDNADSNAIYTLINYSFVNPALISHYAVINDIFKKSYAQPSLLLFGIPNFVFSTVMIKNHPEWVVWYLTDTNTLGNQATNNANLSYLILNKLTNFEELLKENSQAVYDLIASLVQPSVLYPVIEKEAKVSLAIDNDQLYYWLDKSKNATDNKTYEMFNVNLIDDLLKAINTITGLNKMNNILRFDQIGSYVAKANYAWLSRNHKKIYNGKLPTDPYKMVSLLSLLPEEFKINVNGSEYIIIGDDLTYDNIYPVLDEANLQLNPSSQAIVYVNSQGFDRIKQAYRGNLVKEYLLIKNPTNLSNEALKEKLDVILKEETKNADDFQRVFLDDELDMLNPERSIRVTAMKGIVKSVDYASKILLSILVALVTISIIFIIKRYISNKNKVIGILVAQGYTPLEIAASMTVFAFFTIFIGDLLGYITGFLLQGVGLRILENYWTVPIETLTFSWVSLLINIVVPLLAMCVLIIIVSLRSLRFKSIDLMSGIVEVATGEVYKKYANGFKKSNVKTKFSASLIFNSFWKLSSFGISIILTSLTTLFGFATFGVFEESINKTYQNRTYNYRFDLYSPTLEGGPINPYNPTNINNNLYVPIGGLSELDQFQAAYFKPGYSAAVNKDGKNGQPNEFDGHIISQFSVNVLIDSVVGVDPWNSVYNSLPDSQKARILKVRNEVGKALEQTQEVVKYKNGEIDQQATALADVDKKGFFQYFPDADNVMNGKFYYMEFEPLAMGYSAKVINTGNYRDAYREFLVKGYDKIAKNNNELLAKDPKAKTINDFFIGFGGLYLNEQFDEVYTYVDSNITAIKGKHKTTPINAKMYGYNPASKQVKIISTNGVDLLKQINDEYNQNPNAKTIPLIINEVVAQTYDLGIGKTIEIMPNNTVDRYQKELNNEVGIPATSNLQANKYVLKVAGVNPSYINNEFIIPHQFANKILGLNTMKFNPAYNNGTPFNGVLSNNPLPMQILNNASLYSISGYWASIDTFDTAKLTEKAMGELFDGIFGSKVINPDMPNGAMRNIGYSDQEIAKFLNSNYSGSDDVNAIQENYQIARANAQSNIERFAKIFENKLYVPSAASLDSKDIEVNYTMTIAKTVQIVVTLITILTFIVSIVILVIISTILINENEKNIAIWAVLGYTGKEKIRIFFSIYIPFVIISILISLPIAFGLISIFSSFLTTAAQIAIPLAITAANAFLTIGVILFVFIATASFAWIVLNKIKAIDLLKGK
ncbi:FtsX-like permease family protein [Mycoplasma seminis]|uniref:ABC transporter permease n=1 Tax=Mycoplasma seminis TaxID=512749 RepID=A0ABY9HBI3_9MOLU|nr:FtsX-like permease family protein [Mycoplasma seminis]WLP85545.1 ABC transporter permease [Mycoplasma seminis]